MTAVHPVLIRIAARQVRIWRSPAPRGARPNLFLLHGSLGDAAWYWCPVWESLAGSFNIAAPDLPGFGSTVALPNSSFAEWMDWLARVQELVGVSPAIFIGSSFGATFARLYASAYPRHVTALILAGGGQIPRYPKFARRVLRSNLFSFAFELLRRQTFSVKGIQRALGDAALVTPDVSSAAQASSPAFVSLMRHVILSDVPRNQTPRVPTLLIWGDRDKVTSLQLMQEIAAEIPDSKLAVIKNSGHMPQSQDPASFAKIVRDFQNPSSETF